MSNLSFLTCSQYFSCIFIRWRTVGFVWCEGTNKKVALQAPLEEKRSEKEGMSVINDKIVKIEKKREGKGREGKRRGTHLMR